MSQALSPSKVRLFWILLFVATFLFSTFPGKGGLEGDQRNIPSMGNRNDNWGFVVPFIFGNWPNVFGQWRFSVVVLQLFLFWIGLWLLLRGVWNHSTHKRWSIILLTIFSSIFASQLWRDATLLVLATLGFGLISKALSHRGVRRSLFMLLGIFFLHFAAMFKILYGIVLGFIFLWLLYQSKVKQKRYLLISSLVLVSLTASPYLIDKALARQFGLQKVYPEQQPIIFDAASSYCWGTSERLVRDAEAALEVVKRPGFPMKSVCSSLKPTTWDALHMSNNEWQFDAPIERITGNQDQRVVMLREKWLSMITASPIDWMQVRLMYLGWTLTLSNSFVPQNESNTWSGVSGKLNSVAWSIFYSFASFLDKTRVSSILFALLLLGILLINSAIHSFGNRRRFFVLASDQVIGTFVLIAVLALTMIGFVASNGRYVLPYTLLVYMFLLRSENSNTKFI